MAMMLLVVVLPVVLVMVVFNGLGMLIHFSRWGLWHCIRNAHSLCEDAAGQEGRQYNQQERIFESTVRHDLSPE
jgi:hypothetical protein